MTSLFQLAALEGINLPLVATGFVVIAATVVITQYGKRMRPNEPPLLPGGIPIFGHALAFGKNPSKLFEEASKWSTDSQPISVSLLGHRVYFILKSQDRQAAWKEKAVNFDEVVEWGLKTIFGVSEDAVRKLHLHDSTNTGSMYDSVHTFYRDNMAPGEKLNLMTTSFLHWMDKDIQDVTRQLEAAPGGEIKVNLADWVRLRLGIPSTNAFLGPEVLQLDSTMLDRMFKMDNDFLLLSSGLPKWIHKDAHDNVSKMIEAIENGYRRDSTALPFMTSRMDQMAEREVSWRDQAAITFTVWQALQANAIPTAFWMIYGLLYHPKDRRTFEGEIATAFDNLNRIVNLDHLIKNSPFLSSIFWESMRYSAGAVSVRKLTDNVTIGGRTLYKDAMMMLPTRPPHFLPEVFGDDCNEWVADRFVRDGTVPGKKNPGIRAVVPFGGGYTLCPGRHFATNEIISFVATIFRNFDITFCDPSHREVRPKTEWPTLTGLPPDGDVFVRVRLRK
ncbi:hypothetical protein FRC20_001720 [Serendipita sp. 405]|nr:hypothetical protein FRC15_004308 [Serendipita sp. 397]KAG8774230.1 hypothetical protein FRC16_005129 [Serendipita sp. 398]KAG8807836.1 hypothetical protein FRC18_005347 [Serendipita sp. 400]KAG8851561.1 hypothetical protein FRC20_001720 [Serendipita sp. 405]